MQRPKGAPWFCHGVTDCHWGRSTLPFLDVSQVPTGAVPADVTVEAVPIRGNWRPIRDLKAVGIGAVASR